MPVEAIRALHVLSPARIGGLESVVVALTAGLRDAGLFVEVVPVLARDEAHDHPFIQAVLRHGIPCHPVIIGRRSYREERRLVEQHLVRGRAGILHTHGYRSDVLLAGVAKQLGIPHVVTLHGFTGGNWRDRLYEWMQIQAARRAGAVVAVSRTIAERVGPMSQGGLLEVIPNAIEDGGEQVSRDEARLALEIPECAPAVGWIGRFSPEKAPELFVRAMASVDASVHGVMIGDGPLLQSTRQLAIAMGLSRRMRFTGIVPEASRFLQAFDALALTSHTEGTPMVMLEAMRAGVPLVATSVGGVPDVLTDEMAWLCRPGDVDGIAESVSRALGEGRSSTRTQLAHVRLTNDFARAPWVSRHVELYRRLATGTQPRM